MTIAPGWGHIFSRGDRRPISGHANKGNEFVQALTLSSTLSGRTLGDTDNWFNGGHGSGAGFFGGSLVPGTDFIKFHFSEAVCISAIRFWGGDVIDNGNWQLKGSNDDSTYTDINEVVGGADFHWNQVNSGIGSERGCEVEFTNTTDYEYYMFVWVSGSSTTGTWCEQMDFKIPHSDLGGGDRTGLVTATLSGMTERNSPHIAQTLLDGLDDHGKPTAGGDQASWTPPSVNDYVQFDFAANVAIVRFLVNTDFQFNNDYKNWQWYRDDGTGTYVTSGSSFNMQNHTPYERYDSIQPGADPADFSDSWRLVYVGGGFSDNINGMYEFKFDLLEGGLSEIDLSAAMADDGGMSVSLSVVGTIALSAAMADDLGMSVDLTILGGPVNLSAAMADDGGMQTMLTILTRVIVQTIVIVTGR